MQTTTTWPNATVGMAPPSNSVSPHQAMRTGFVQVSYVLFLLVNAVLYVRPTEYVPGIVGLQFYECLIIPCLLAALPVLMMQVDLKSLERHPITVCVIGLLFVVILSHLARIDIGLAWDSGIEFVKMVLYFLLFVGLVVTPYRLRQVLFLFPLFTIVIAGLAVAEWHNLVELEQFKLLLESKKGEEVGLVETYGRLQATGIFRDPNDLCVLLAVSIIMCLYWLTDNESGAARLFWVLPIALFLYAVLLTQSRGGLLALMGGLFILFVSRFGMFFACLLGSPVILGLLLLAGGRQTELAAAGTAMSRVELWSDSLLVFRGMPLFGIGYSLLDENIGLVAHNSYLQCFAELGLLGGMFFLGAFGTAWLLLVQYRPAKVHVLNPQLQRMQPYVLAILTSYMIGMMTLTLSYVVPTFTILGIAAAYLGMVRSDPPGSRPKFDGTFLLRTFGLSVGFLFVMYIFVRVVK